MQTNLSELIYEAVTDEYGWGCYGDFRVLIRRRDGYINATKLCEEGGKEFFNWKKLKLASNLISQFEAPSDQKGPLDELSSGSSNLLRGTYAHPLLIPHIASWVSAEFAFRVSKIVNDHIIKEYREAIYQRDVELGKRKEKIDELIIGQKRLIEQNDLLQQKLDLANENIIEAVRGVSQANRSISGVQTTLKNTAANHVPEDHLQPKDIETYAIYYCGFNQERNSHRYIQCRARPFHFRRRVKALEERYGDELREVIVISPVPNARALASEFERRIQDRGITFSLKQQLFYLPEEEGVLEEQEMVRIAREVFEERNVPAEEAAEAFVPVDMDITEEGKIQVITEEKLTSGATDEPPPTREERFAALMRQTMAQLKEIARGFSRSKVYGGHSGKNKTDLVNWIIARENSI